MSNSLQIIMNGEELRLALQRISLQILERNQAAGRLAIVGIHTRGVFLAERIKKIIDVQTSVPTASGALDITLYRDDWSLISQNPVVKTTSIDFDIEGVELVLVDDVIYTGRTIRAAMDALMDYGRPHTIQLACLVDRGERQLPIQPDYVGLITAVRPDERIEVQLSEMGGQDQVVIER
ncbi:bifunctional pyr operon transcriptional regulator/uracil phosphoribosyltransferase PyrR [Desulfofustis limnaeus]|uniref:Bifunctional protein PyrR n=1 Tax=Desulfofustis limnaeus TaxID=2740163 RepID=A0ABN6M668_9BACT|nr:bifunctional pyr operon transcriptional regulator/uracil phosphoribosyltransferase PyrR [Desulfofustis limnaeus]BDD87420.1 bifunctional protein PyrR [Desulfofustis limnaeus]